MDPLRLTIELLFGIVFLAVARRYLRRRDAISRDLVLAFAGLGLTLVVEIWRAAIGPTPPPIGIALAALLLLQPLFVLHLVSLIRDVSRFLLVGATVVYLGSVAAAVILRPVPVFSLIAVGAFIGIEAIAAALLLLEARRRSGPGAVRLAIAAGSTALFAATLVSAGVGSLGEAIAPPAAVVAIILALLAAIGYLVAFVPPAAIARAWQASGTVGYVRSLLENAGEPPEVLWAKLAGLATAVRGGNALVVVPGDDGTGSIAASSGSRPTDRLKDRPTGEPDRLSAALLARLQEAARGGADALVDEALVASLPLSPGDRRMSVLPLSGSPTSPLLVLLSRHDSLFDDADRELLAALGAQTAIVVERRIVVAQQEELAARLRSTVEALRAASQAKSDFLASMSHELRTPLSAILGFSDLMRTEPSTDGNVTVPLEWVEHMHRGGEHLVSLINDVLDLAKVEAGRLELHPEILDLGAIAAEVANGVRPIAERKQIVLTVVAASTPLSADRGRVRQILYNLLSNAIKYTNERGAVELRIATTGSRVEIEVRDTGVGIAPDDLEIVFEEFRQVGDPEAHQQGTGLGLALTKRLVEAHSGSIRVESTIGVGSTFTVSLPGVAALPAPAPIVAPRELAVGEAQSVRGRAPVLLIEDDPSAVRLLREYLEPNGYTVHAASTGHEGLALARELRPAAVILDVLLPGVDGWEILRQIKADAALSSLPVIIVTVVDEREVGLALGAADYIVKPIRRDALLDSLDRHVRRSGDRPNPKVLAVDDDPVALELVRAALEPEGFDVRTTTSSVAALQMVLDGQFDVVVSDVVMPELDGLQLAEMIHANLRTAGLPILLVTAHDLSAAEKAMLNGQIIGVASKGGAARSGLLRWLEPYRRKHAPGPAA
jgi:signal transduction histidine kinase/DNA-binding response OmpR family regulator